MEDSREVGRPTKYKPEYCQEIIDYMIENRGASIVEFAAHICVGKSTIHDWAKTIPEFSDALDKAKAIAEAWWAKTGREGIFMGGKDNPFNSAVYNFTMAARFGWSQKIEQKQEIEAKGLEITYSKKDQ